MSKSTPSTKSAGSSQDPAANTDVGKATVRGSVIQASSGGRKAAKVTEMATNGLMGTASTDQTYNIRPNIRDKLVASKKVKQPLIDSERMQQSAVANTESSEGNAQFMKYLQAVYAAVKKLELEVTIAPNTKKEIKAATVSLTSATSNLVKWGRIFGRLNPVTRSKECQMDMANMDSEGTTKGAIGSPDRSRFEEAGAIQYLKDEMKIQKNAMANLTAKMEKLFGQKQQRKDQRQPHQQQQKELQPKSQTLIQNEREGQLNASQQQHHQSQDDESESENIHQVSEWTEVVKRKKKRQEPQHTGDTGQVTRPRPIRVKKPAIIKANAEEFPALAKKLKAEVSISAVREKIVAMRQTKRGDMLIEIDGDPKSVGDVRDEITRIAGGEASISELSQNGLLEVRDIDNWSDKVEVRQAIGNEAGIPLDAVHIISLRKTYAGTQTAIALLPLRVAVALASKVRVRISLVNCRVRMAEKRTRCYRCLGMGHTSKDCTGPDRGGRCLRCGVTGHRAAQCDADRDTATDFRVELLKPSNDPSSPN